jgi:uridine phosphorylase
MNKTIAASELILNPDGSIYHLALRPEHIAPTVITVGDPQRVEKISSYFDELEFKQQKREFVTHTGRIGDQRLTVIATGIGTDNIDIVFNELDALVNIDLATRLPKEEHTALNLIRIGTSGSIREDIPVDSFVVSNYGIGLEGLMLFYQQNLTEKEQHLKEQFNSFLKEQNFQFPIPPTIQKGSTTLINKFQSEEWKQGITFTATGFYAPQNRQLRAKSIVADLFDVVHPFAFDGLNITNLEMETAGIYGLANILGHHALSLNAILANRPTGVFSSDPKGMEKKLIEKTLDILC